MIFIYNKMSCFWEVCLNRGKWLKRLLRTLLVGFLIAPSKKSDGGCGASSYVRNCSMSVLDFRTQMIMLKKRVGFTTVFFPHCWHYYYYQSFLLADTIIITNRFYFGTAIQSYFCKWLSSQFCCSTLVAPIWTALSQFAEVSATTPVAIETSRSERQQMADVLAATEQNIIVFLVPSLSWWSKNSFCAQCWLSRILTCGNRSFLIQWLIKCHWA